MVKEVKGVKGVSMIDVQKIAENIAARIEELDSKKAEENELHSSNKNEEKARHKKVISSVNAELEMINRLAGTVETPSKSNGSKKRKSPLINIAVGVLKANKDSSFTGSEIAQEAVDSGLWADPPVSYRANMSRVLSNFENYEQSRICLDENSRYSYLDDADEE
jgi:hypothetical protein